MENSFQTSFIPKNPKGNLSDRKVKPDLITIVSISVLVLIAVASLGMVFYKMYLNNQKEKLSENLMAIKNSFDQDTIFELEQFSKRTDIAKNILNSHVALSPLFKLLAEITIPSVQYTDFDYQNSENTHKVKIKGVSRDYKSIAVQSEIFNSPSGRFLKNIVFSDLIKDKNNYVGFSVEFDLDPSLLSYEKNLIIENSMNTTTEQEVVGDDLLNQGNNQ